VQKCVKEFGISRYLVKTSKKLKKEHGILPDIGIHGAKPIDDNTVKCVHDFYRDDMVSAFYPVQRITLVLELVIRENKDSSYL